MERADLMDDAPPRCGFREPSSYESEEVAEGESTYGFEIVQTKRARSARCW